MAFSEVVISINKTSCERCYACIRVCPTKALKIGAEDNFPELMPERCIACGHCVTACAPGAILYREDKEKTRDLIAGNSKTAAIVDPSISGEYHDITDYRKFVEMIRALGFDYVSEIAFGVDVVSRQYKTLLDNFKGKYYISANCPAVVHYVEKFHPELVDNMAPIVSPMVAMAKIMRKQYGGDLKVVSIGPCIAAKQEALRYSGASKVNAVLTFVELREMFQEAQINEAKLEYSDFDPPIGRRGSLYPISRGWLQAAGLSEDLIEGKLITAEGQKNMIDAIFQFKDKGNFIQRNLNLFYNEGCLMGPGTSKGGEKFLRRTLVTDYVAKRLKSISKGRWEEYLRVFSQLDYTRAFKSDDQRLPEPSEEKIREILKIIGQQRDDREMGCQVCGYRSCRDFAVAVSKGIAKPEMCHTYTARKTNQYIESLRKTNAKLEETQQALEISEKTARKEQQLAKEASQRSTTMLKKLPSAVVIVDDKLKILESNEQFIEIMGEQAREINEIIPGLVEADLKSLVDYTIYNLFSFVLKNNEDIMNKDVKLGDKLFNISIFTINKHKIVGAVLRDMYKPEVRKDEVIRRVKDVIDDNLGMVQQIGYLLGESASVIEKKLSTIIESYSDEQEKGKNERPKADSTENTSDDQAKENP
ncbi:MAG: [Fe-Fe] hydrogenase large subunit C-terminal domain-containing protein [Bacteroidales bacterium]